MNEHISLMVKQQMQCKQSMCKQKCIQMSIFNCIKTNKLINTLESITS